MNILKKISICLIISIFSLSLSSNAFGAINQKTKKKPEKHMPKPRKPHHPMGAPLDAGILAILASAGSVYYLIRKKKNDN